MLSLQLYIILFLFLIFISIQLQKLCFKISYYTAYLKILGADLNTLIEFSERSNESLEHEMIHFLNEFYK